MIVSIHQPNYFPWLGLLDKISKTDTFVLLDSVPLNDSAFQNRNLFLTSQNNVQYLTIPLQKKNHIAKPMHTLLFATNNWQKKHEGFIRANYGKHKFFDEVWQYINPVFNQKFSNFGELSEKIIKISLKLFNLQQTLLVSSKINLTPDLSKESLILDILLKLQADAYLSGEGAREYQVEQHFLDKEVALYYQEFTHPVYSQKHSKEFSKGLSCLDIAFNIGIEKCHKLFPLKS